MIWLIICIIALAIIDVIMAINIAELKEKLKVECSWTEVMFWRHREKFDKLTDKHNAFVDAVRDEFDNIYDETNERIDEINWQFHNIYNVLNEQKEFADDVTDTMELMCDTDEMIIDRINDIEEDLAIANTELDDIIVSIFEEEEEEVEEKPAKKSKKK